MMSTKLVFYILSLPIILVLSQDLQLFPGAAISKWKKLLRKKFSPPEGVTQHTLRVNRKVKLDVWELPADTAFPTLPYVALIYHGNAAPLTNFTLLQIWAASLGIKSYALDYRGYGNSTGWPSEQGIYEDSDAFLQFVMEREGIRPDQIILLGYSVGAAPAARTAMLHNPALLILVSAFTSVQDIINNHPIGRYFERFVWSRCPTQEFVSQLSTTKLILMHGGNDTIVPPSHLERLAAAYRGSVAPALLFDPEASHNTVFFSLREQLSQTVLSLLKRTH